MCPLSNPLYLCIKLFIMHFLCIYAVRPCQVQDVISQHLFKLSTQFFQYNKTHDLFSDQHLCQVAPKLSLSSERVMMSCETHGGVLSFTSEVLTGQCLSRNPIRNPSIRSQHRLGLCSCLKEFLMLWVRQSLKDRQQEAERHLRYLALLSSANDHHIITYISNESLYFSLSNHINDFIIIIISLQL